MPRRCSGRRRPRSSPATGSPSATQAATAGAIVWLAGNLGGLVVAVVVQALVHHPTGAFLAMAALSLLALKLAERFRLPLVPTTSF